MLICPLCGAKANFIDNGRFEMATCPDVRCRMEEFYVDNDGGYYPEQKIWEEDE